ncbi:hypothetical protein [Vibrio ouci]|uniref:hypothetical protein n=1 Tax=Vibrio ouci TaxID=2499078 RepID=UPI00142E58DD|nr:hypothetical protein [Vibrio ouci]
MFKTIANGVLVIALIIGLSACGGDGGRTPAVASSDSLVLPQQLEVVTNETE